VTRVSALAMKCAFAVPLLLLEKSEAEDSATVNLSRNPQSELPAATPANWCGDGSPTVQLSGCKAEGVNV